MRAQSLKISRWSWALLLAWTSILIASYFWNTHQVTSLLLDQARTELRANFFKDQTFRLWATGHGGVYVPVTETQQPDPYIDFIPERDVLTPSGTVLTLINPALMVRQFNELAREKYAIEGKISGLKPLNPINAADEWEWQAFEQFQQGSEEVTAIADIAGKPFLRLIRPMYMAAPCLKCHAHQGYKEGDLSGGVSVSVSLQPIERMQQRRMITLAGGHIIIWAIGFAGILFGRQQISQQIEQREQVYLTLEESEARTRNIICSSMDAIITANEKGEISGWNEQAKIIFGWDESEATGSNLANLIIPERYRNDHNTGFTNAVKNGASGTINRRIELVGLRKDGEEFPIELSIVSTSTSGEITFNAFIRDISDRKKWQQKVERDYASQQLISSILEISLQSQGFEKRLELILQRIIDTSWLQILPHGAVFICRKDQMLEMVAQIGLATEAITTYSTLESVECQCGKLEKQSVKIKKGDLSDSYGHQSPGIDEHGHYCIPIQTGEETLGVLTIGVAHDHQNNDDELTLLSTICHTIGTMIQRNEAEETLLHNAYHDDLTNLPNRTLFIDRLQQRLSRYQRTPESLFAVLFLDLDRFKVINDSLGHSVGDKLLVKVASRILECIRPEDTLARLGGDEFTILLDDLTSERDVSLITQRIFSVLRDPFEIDSLTLSAPCSIGVAFASEHYQDPEEMLRDADTAMYRAKSLSGTHTVFFDEAMHTSAIERLNMETDLLHATEENELRVHYQPIISAKTGLIEGVEALARWPLPDGGMISPVDFIPVAEETGLINEIGAWVLREACRQTLEWRTAFPQFENLYVSVNISGKQLLQNDVFDFIEAILQGIDYNPRHLRLEITESTLMDNHEGNTELLNRFREHGYRFYIDDFGTGYSSLSYLHSFPFDALKIDRSFVTNLASGDEHRKMIETIISIAHNFGMKVVAEGIETEEQQAQLTAMGCEYLQGYHFSRPLSAEELFNWLSNHTKSS